MKTKTLFLIFIIFVGFASPLLAQEDEVDVNVDVDFEEEYLKPDYGMFTVEYGLSPLSENPIALEHLRLRYFIDYDLAIRASLILDGEQGGNTALQERNRLKWGIEAGMEFHGAGTKNLSPYVGFELQYVNETLGQENTVGASVETNSGVWLDSFGGVEAQGKQRIGVSYIMGADIYILKNFYVGLELGVNFGYDSYQDHDRGILDLENSATNVSRGGESFNVVIDANNFIRVGYAF